MTQSKSQVASQPTAYTAKQRAEEEGRKLQHDSFKHLTTLSTGSILLLITFLEKVFIHPQWRSLIVIALAAFVLSILASIWMMMMLAGLVMSLGDLKKEKVVERVFWIGISVAGGGFLLGIICLVIFAIKNLLM